MKALKFAIALCIGFLLTGEVFSGNIGVVPAVLDYKVMKGESFPNHFNIDNTGSLNEAIFVNVSVYCEYDPSMSKWFSIEPSGVFEVPANTKKRVEAIVKPPEDAPSGNYTCFITVMPVHDEENLNITGSKIIMGASALARIDVSGDEIVGAKIHKTDASDTEVGKPVILTIQIRNSGNVKIKPEIKVDIMKDGNLVDTVEETADFILPGSGNIIDMKWDTSGTTHGDYIAHFDVFIRDEKLDPLAYIIDTGRGENITIEQNVSFRIFEEGTFTKTGAVMSMEAKETINKGEISEIVVQFKNTGEVEITAKSEIKVYSNDNLINLLESNSLSISPGETGSLTSYFKGENSGDYVLKGRVIYENKEAAFDKDINIKVSPEKDDIIKQEPAKTPDQGEPPKSDSSLIWVVGILAVVLIIAAILFMRR